MNFNWDTIIRENIKRMIPYSSARHEYAGPATIFLDANENAFGSPLSANYNRYPDPLQVQLKQKISTVKAVPEQNIFLGNGSDEAIDLLFRTCCKPGQDNVIILPPTYGMYEVCAAINDIEVKKIPLTETYQMDLNAIEEAIDPFTKMVFICSPNNPTGNSINCHTIETLLSNFAGLVVIDEAYINYAKQKSFTTELGRYPNLVLLQTLSKAWGLAGLRLGMAFAAEELILYMNKVKYPYNINIATQQLALEALDHVSMTNERISSTIAQRDWLKDQLLKFPFVKTVHPSDANFVLVKMEQAGKIFQHLSSKGIIVRDRSTSTNCGACLRITIGTPDENQQLINTLKEYRL